MNTKPEFHGSDLEKIEKYYNIPKESIVRFAANVNPLGLSDKIKKEICENIDLISTYPDREYTSLRRSIGEYCGVNPDNIIVGNGSTELISLLIQQRYPKKALLLGPTYSEYSRELSFSDCIQEYHHLSAEDNFALSLSDLFKRLEDGFDFLIICNPNNPTSSAVTVGQMKEILTFCKSRNIFVMIDETYVEFSPVIDEISAMSLISKFDNFMILRGVSKFYAAPGLRLGYGVTSNKEFLKNVKEHQIPWSLNSIGAFAGERFFKDKDYIEKTRKLILSERDRMLTELRKISDIQVFDAYANFILVHIFRPSVTSTDFFEACIRKGLMIRDCSSFECLEGEYVRFCIMNPEDNDRLLQVFKETFA